MKGVNHKRLQQRANGAVVLSARITFLPQDKEIIAVIEAAPRGKVAVIIRELVRAGFRARRQQEITIRSGGHE